MSALPPIADIAESDWNVRFVPKADSCTAAKNCLYSKRGAAWMSEVTPIRFHYGWRPTLVMQGLQRSALGQSRRLQQIAEMSGFLPDSDHRPAYGRR